MTNPVYTVGLELVAGSFTNVSSDVLRFNVDRQLGTLFRPLQAGTALIEFANFNGKYSPANAGSAFAGLLLPNKRVQITASYAGNSYAIFTGWAKQWQTNPDMAQRTTVLHAQDVFSKLNNTIVTTSLFTGINPASLFCCVMSACNVNSFASDALPGDSIDFAWFTNLGAQDALQRIVNFGRYGVYQDGAGTVQLKSRYATLFSTAVSSFVNNFLGFEFTLDDQLVLNDVKVSGIPHQLSTTVNTVAWLKEIITIPASSAVSFWLGFVNPTQSALTCPANSVSAVRSADYLCNANSGGTGSDMTSTTSLSATYFGETAVVTVFNGAGSTGYLTKFQLRGFSAIPLPSISYATNNTSSQNTYGEHAFKLDDDFIGNTVYIKPYGDSLLLDRKEALPLITPSVKNQFPDIFTVDVGNVVSIVESLTGVTSQYIVQHLIHDVQLLNGLEHTLNMEVEYTQDLQYLILDDASRGVLDGARVLAF